MTHYETDYDSLPQVEPILLVNQLLNGREAIIIDDEYAIAFGE